MATFSSVTGQGSVEYADEGCFDQPGKFIMGPFPGTPQYDFGFPNSPGVDGSGSINYGYRDQKISLEVAYVSEAIDSLATDVDNDQFTLAAGLSDLSLNSVTYKACQCLGFEATSKIKSTGLVATPYFYQTYMITVTAKRTD